MTPAQRDSTKVKIDISLRTVKTLLGFGKVDFAKVDSTESNILSKPFNNALKRVQEEIKDLPALSAYVGVYFVGKTVLNMMTSSGLVEIDS
jgi:hypothetical protein